MFSFCFSHLRVLKILIFDQLSTSVLLFRCLFGLLKINSMLWVCEFVSVMHIVGPVTSYLFPWKVQCNVDIYLLAFLSWWRIHLFHVRSFCNIYVLGSSSWQLQIKKIIGSQKKHGKKTRDRDVNAKSKRNDIYDSRERTKTLCKSFLFSLCIFFSSNHGWLDAIVVRYGYSFSGGK